MYFLLVINSCMHAHSARSFLALQGFCNWKDGTVAFRQHEKSVCHKLAVEKVITLLATTSDVGEMLSTALARDRANNRHFLLKILSSLQYLARQGCAIRGHDDKCDGNLYQLMKFVSKNDSKVINVVHF